MKNFVMTSATDASQSPKVAAVVAGGTTGSGVATTFDWIPFWLGEIATVLGICLSLILIITTVLAHFARMRLINAQIKDLEQKEGEQ